MITFTKDNTVTGAITLNINSTGAKPLSVLASKNTYTDPGEFGAGTYQVYYNGYRYILIRSFDDVPAILFPD